MGVSFLIKLQIWIDKKTPMLETVMYMLFFIIGNISLAAIVSLELARNLKNIDKIEEAHNHFVRTANIQKQYSIIDYMNTLKMAAECRIQSGDYLSALEHYGDIWIVLESLSNANKDYLTFSLKEFRKDIEILRVFVLLLLNTSPMDMLSEHSKILEHYTWEGTNESDKVLPEELFLLIQSVVMATQSRDIDMLEDVQIELYTYLDQVQFDLLHRIVGEYKS